MGIHGITVRGVTEQGRFSFASLVLNETGWDAVVVVFSGLLNVSVIEVFTEIEVMSQGLILPPGAAIVLPELGGGGLEKNAV